MNTSPLHMPKLSFSDNSNIAELLTLNLPDLSWVNNFANQIQEIALMSQRISAALIEPALQMQKNMEALTSMFNFWELPTSKQAAVVADPELKTVEKLKENHLLPKEILTFSENKFFLYGQTMKVQKINSQHFLLLRALITLRDSEGFCSYERIEDFLRFQGLPHLIGEQMRKRICNALRTAQRFYSLPSSISSGLYFIEVKKGKGLIIRNRIRT